MLLNKSLGAPAAAVFEDYQIATDLKVAPFDMGYETFKSSDIYEIFPNLACIVTYYLPPKV